MFALLNEKGYRLYEIRQEEWQAIPAMAEMSLIAFVDGGNSLMLQTPAAELHKIRAAIAVTEGKKLTRLKQKEGLLLAKAKVEDGKVTHEAFFLESSFGSREILKFPEVANSEKPLGKAAETFRKLCEMALAKEAIDKMEGGFIVLDGTLETFSELEEKEMRELRDAAAAKNITLGSVAKTCSLLADNGDSLISAVEKAGNGNREGYLLVAEGKGERHKAAIAIARLHTAAQHLFRVEAATQEDLRKLLAALKSQSNDIAFPGYPYGLVMADLFARVSNNEAEMQRAKIGASGELKELINNEKALDAHSILDRL